DLDQAVDYREQRVGLDVARIELAEQEGRDLPGHQVDGEIVAEPAQLHPRLSKIVEYLETVDDDEAGRDRLDTLDNGIDAFLEPSRAQRVAEINELHAVVVELPRIEKFELAQDRKSVV